MLLNVLNSLRDHREPVDFANGMRRFVAVFQNGDEAFEGVEFSNGQVAISNREGMLATHPSLKSVAQVADGTLRLLWLGDADNKQQSQEREEARARGYAAGEQSRDGEVDSLRGEIRRVVEFVYDEMGKDFDIDGLDDARNNEEDASHYINHAFDHQCRTVEQRERRIASIQSDLNSITDFNGRLLSRNGTLIGHLRVARNIIETFVTPAESLSVYLEARRQAEKFLEDAPK